MQLSIPRIAASAFIAPNASIFGDITISENAVVLFGVVMRAEFSTVTIGSNTNVQDNTVLHCDEGLPCNLGSNVTVGHAAVIHGATIGDHCLVGIGAKALNGSVLGEGSWLAAGSLLPEGKSIAPWTLAVGIPAKPLRDLTSEEIERQRDGVADYQRLRLTYKRLLS